MPSFKNQYDSLPNLSRLKEKQRLEEAHLASQLLAQVPAIANAGMGDVHAADREFDIPKSGFEGSALHANLAGIGSNLLKGTPVPPPQEAASVLDQVVPRRPAIKTPAAPAPLAEQPAPEGNSRDQVRQYLMEKYGFGEANDSIDKAQDFNREMQGDALKAQAFAQLGAAFTGGATKVDPSFYKGIAAQGEQALKDVTQRRDGRVADLKQEAMVGELAGKQMEQDPSSQQSIALRDFYKNTFPDIVKQTPNFEFLSASDIKEYLAKPIELRQRAEENRLKFEAIATQKKIAQDSLNESRRARLLADYQKRAESHPLVKLADERLNGVSTIKGLLPEAVMRGGQSLAALGPQAAKAMGERGVLTEGDVVRYVKNPQLSKALWGTYLRWTSGKLDPGDAENIDRVMNIMQTKADELRQEAYNRVSTQYSRSMGMAEDEARFLIDPYHQPGDANKPKPSGSIPPGKIKISNGAETLFIDPQDLPEAMAEDPNFKQVE